METWLRSWLPSVLSAVFCFALQNTAKLGHGSHGGQERAGKADHKASLPVNRKKMTIPHYRERVMGTKIRVPSVVKSTSRVTAIVPGTSQSKNLLRFFFLLSPKACRSLIPWPGIEPKSPEVETQSLNHWAAREAGHLISLSTVNTL